MLTSLPAYSRISVHFFYSYNQENLRCTSITREESKLLLDTSVFDVNIYFISRFECSIAKILIFVLLLLLFLLFLLVLSFLYKKNYSLLSFSSCCTFFSLFSASLCSRERQMRNSFCLYFLVPHFRLDTLVYPKQLYKAQQVCCITFYV